jgi:hypothetical protein
MIYSINNYMRSNSYAILIIVPIRRHTFAFNYRPSQAGELANSLKLSDSLFQSYSSTNGSGRLTWNSSIGCHIVEV